MEKTKVLVIGAHPADPIDLAGGTAYQMRRGGCNVYALSLTNGVNSHSTALKDKNESEIDEIKKHEFIDACEILDIVPQFFEYIVMSRQDEPLIIDRSSVQFLASSIRTIRPDIVITHHPNEFAHWDHSSCGEIVCRALKAAIKLPNYAVIKNNDPWYVPTVYFFAVQFRPEVGRLGIVPQPPDVLVDIEESIFKKAQAMACFKSQGITMESMEKRLKSFEGEMGRADGLNYAEGFSLYYPLKRKNLPVNRDKGFYK
jgi:LmbE family N-acetylglucosaminyl deacetylase